MHSQREIIDAVRRIASAGMTPGRARFTRETGTPPVAWRRYWPNWSAVVEAAGYPPNPPTPPIPREVLLKYLCDAIEELGEWPTDARHRMFHESRGWPRHTTFNRRLGTQAQQASNIIEHADALGASQHVVDIARAKLNEPRDTRAKSDTAARPEGYVYLIRHGRRREYKIGWSNDPHRRRYELSIQTPERPTLVHEIASDDPPRVERYWHDRFRDKRKHGEWFELTDADVREFKRWRPE